MRILVTIPHFFRQAAIAEYGSERGDMQKRKTALTRALLSLSQTFGDQQAHMNNIRSRCNGALTTSIDIVICTVGENHIIQHLPGHLFKHHHTECDPRLLGYECHTVLAKNIGSYDFYCFLEDDLEIVDPLFFLKLKWFTDNVGNESALQPHRFEQSLAPPVRKLYIDGRLRDVSWSSQFQDINFKSVIQGSILGQAVKFIRTDNPHSGCFFLTQTQMEFWMKKPYFLDRSQAFAGPLESAATLGLMRAFRVYKPAEENASFLELQHLDNRYLGTRIRFADDFRLT